LVLNALVIRLFLLADVTKGFRIATELADLENGLLDGPLEARVFVELFGPELLKDLLSTGRVRIRRLGTSAIQRLQKSK